MTRSPYLSAGLGAAVACAFLGPSMAAAQVEGRDTAPAFETFTLDELVSRRRTSGRPYLPFLSIPSMRAGLYVLAAGADDRQQPHDQDELYYVVSGRGQITVDGTTQPVGPGSVIFVKADVAHRFHDVSEELEIIVFFSTAPSR